MSVTFINLLDSVSYENKKELDLTRFENWVKTLYSD